MDQPPLIGRDGPAEEEESPLVAQAAARADWRVHLTDADVRAAKLQWLTAHDGAAPEALVDLLYQDYVHLISAQAQQFADDLRRR